MKFTDEEWSRVLSAHEGGQLNNYGSAWEYGGSTACVLQAASENASPWDVVSIDRDLSIWFDCHYEPTWRVSRLISGLEAQGC